MHHQSVEMRECIDECLKCHIMCLSTAMNHCLEVGGEHVAPAHFRLIAACAEICQTAANFMLISSTHHQRICRECAAICDECAASCERLGGMEECAAACRQCADSCRGMAA